MGNKYAAADPGFLRGIDNPKARGRQPIILPHVPQKTEAKRFMHPHFYYVDLPLISYSKFL